MYLHLENLVYLTFYNDAAIFLNANKNEFKVFVGERYDFLKDLIKPDAITLTVTLESKDPSKLSVLKQLIDLGLLKQKTASLPYPCKIDIKEQSKGCDQTVFRLSNHALDKSHNGSFFKTIQYLQVLFKVHRTSRNHQFKGIITLLQKEKNKRNNYITPDRDALKQLADDLDQACFYFYKKSKCLEWAAAYVLIALKKGWQCNLVVGVQTYSFFSHAWVTCQDVVIGDVESLPDTLSQILVEPFQVVA